MGLNRNLTEIIIFISVIIIILNSFFSSGSLDEKDWFIIAVLASCAIMINLFEMIVKSEDENIFFGVKIGYFKPNVKSNTKRMFGVVLDGAIGGKWWHNFIMFIYRGKFFAIGWMNSDEDENGESK